MRSWLVLLYLSCAWLSGCAPSARRAPANLGPGEAVPAGPSTGLRVLTFNAGLAPGLLARTKERATELAKTLSAAETSAEAFDVACLQEVWLERDALMVKRAIGTTSVVNAGPTYSTGRLATPVWLGFVPEPAALYCAPSELPPLASCVANMCRGEMDITSCVLDKCRPVLDRLSPDCVACLSRDLSKPLEALAECRAPAAVQPPRAWPSAQEPVVTPGVSSATPYLLGGAYGTALVSRLPVLKQGLLRLESTMHPRGVIYARVRHPQLGSVDVYCTHLTPILSGVQRPGGGSFVLEQSAQVQRLIEITEPQGNIPVVLLGDLNTGPAGPRAPPLYRAQAPQHYARLLEAGFLDAASDERCSYCFDNPLQPRPRAGGLRIDHVLTRGAVLRAEQQRRRFDAPSLSDHYGVEVLLGAERAREAP